MVRPDANSTQLWYSSCRMWRTTGRSVKKSLLLGVVLWGVIVAAVAAQEPGVQPSIHIVLISEGEGSLPPAIVAAVEARLAAQRRYSITKSTTDMEPEDVVSRKEMSGYDAIIFIRQSRRLDDTLRGEFDVYADGAFVRSGETPVEGDGALFPRIDTFASDVASAVASAFPGFGRLRFTNSGFPHNYYVYADDTFLGANITEIELPVGEYTIEIRRRDDGFSHVVGRRTVRLADDDFLEIEFSMARQAPPVPGFLRLTNPNDRWRGIVTFRGVGMLPLEGFEEASTDVSWATAATVLFGHVPFRNLVIGVETEFLNWEGVERGDTLSGDPDILLDIRSNSILGVLGVTVGPVSGVDFVARVGAGVAMYRVEATAEYGGMVVGEDKMDDCDPAFNGTVEFGFGIGKYGRLSLQTALFGVYSPSERDLHSWLQLGVGIGGRF